MKNDITSLRNHLFLQLERLNDEDLSAEKMQIEIDRSNALSNLAKVIVDSAKTEVLFIKVTDGGRDSTKFFTNNIAIDK